MINDFRFRVVNEPHRFGFAVFMFNEHTREMVKPAVLEVEYIEKNTVYGPPTFEFSTEQAQNLMDELWKAGVRPNNGESSVSHVEALKYHLEDMRKLVKGLVK